MRYPHKVLYNPQQEELIISRQKVHHTKQFKLDAINYRKEHPDLTQVECAKNLGIGVIPSLDGKPSFGIMAVIFQLLAMNSLIQIALTLSGVRI